MLSVLGCIARWGEDALRSDHVSCNVVGWLSFPDRLYVSSIICVVAPSGGPQGHSSLRDCTGRGHIGWEPGEVVP